MDKKLITDYLKNSTKTEAKRENRIRMSEETWSFVEAVKDAKGYTTVSEAVEYLVNQGLFSLESAAKKQAQKEQTQNVSEASQKTEVTSTQNIESKTLDEELDEWFFGDSQGQPRQGLLSSIDDDPRPAGVILAAALGLVLAALVFLGVANARAVDRSEVEVASATVTPDGATVAKDPEGHVFIKDFDQEYFGSTDGTLYRLKMPDRGTLRLRPKPDSVLYFTKVP